VDLEPRQGVGENRPVRERTACAGRGRRIEHAPLERENLRQPLDVTPRQWQRAQRGAYVSRAISRLGRESERDEQRAEQVRVRERLGHRLEARAIPVERGERAPQPIRRPFLNLGRHRFEQAVLDEAAEGLLGPPAPQNLVEPLHQPRRRRAADLAAMPCDGLDNRWIDREAEPRGERERAEHPNRILDEPIVGIPDRANEPVADVLQTADVVDDRPRPDVIEERVHREVAAEGVLFRRAKRVLVRERPVAGRLVRGRDRHGGGHFGFGLRRLVLGARRHLAAERRDLDGFRAELHVREPEAAADDPAVPEQALHLIRVGGGPDVEVLRPAAQQQVADAPAHEVRRVIELCEAVEHLERVGVDVRAGNGVVGPGQDEGIRHLGAL
jgi:hypothetical protein